VVLAKRHRLLEGLKPVIMFDRGQALLKVVLLVFGKDKYAFYLRHLAKNFMQVAGKHGIKKEATKQLVKEMLYRIAYAPTLGEYNVAMQELRAYKSELAKWVGDNEHEQWAEAKFRKERWGRLNSNVIESWNNWMHRLRPISVPLLVSGHLKQLGKKFGKHKDDIDKWVNGVGE